MTDADRRTFLKKSLAFGAVASAGISLSGKTSALDNTKQQLEVAAIRFSTTAELGDPTSGRTGSVVKHVAGPLKTTVMLFKDDDLLVCFVATDFSSSDALQDVVAKQLNIPKDHVIVFSSHNHSVPLVSRGGVGDTQYNALNDRSNKNVVLYPVGERLVEQLRESAARLPDMLEPVSVWYAEGTEGRITYNRKGRRADGSTYFMREEDRELVGGDFNGDIDRQAPVIVFKNSDGQAVAGLVQFTGHPVTSYHPENPVVYGDWPQTATDIVARELAGGGKSVPVGFLQGCPGDVNSKEMFNGGVERARQFGEMLGESYTKALKDLKLSTRGGMDYAAEAVPVPLAPLPSKETLIAEVEEIENFIKRARDGDPDTLECVGLNFPVALSPSYRAALVEAILPWSEWALDLQRTGRADTAMKAIDLPIHVIRLGDVGILGMRCEPFQGIGRRFRQLSSLPLSIPCGYANGSHGYITDSANTGDREYMSAFYRYTRFRPPLLEPAGDVLADRAAEFLARS